jgi:hypothetical protein
MYMQDLPMKTLTPRWIPFVAAAALALAAACQKEDSATKDRLDRVLSKLDDIEKKLDRAGPPGRGAAAPGPQPGRPDPSAVYSVPIDGNPFEGPANAKVTIVEAAEFA